MGTRNVVDYETGTKTALQQGLRRVIIAAFALIAVAFLVVGVAHNNNPAYAAGASGESAQAANDGFEDADSPNGSGDEAGDWEALPSESDSNADDSSKKEADANNDEGDDSFEDIDADGDEDSGKNDAKENDASKKSEKSRKSSSVSPEQENPPAGDLKITKKLAEGSSTQQFTFEVTLSNVDASKMAESYTVEGVSQKSISFEKKDNEYKGTLKVEAGKTATIKALPVDAKFAIVESTIPQGFEFDNIKFGDKTITNNKVEGDITNTTATGATVPEVIFTNKAKQEPAKREKPEKLVKKNDADKGSTGELTLDSRDDTFYFTISQILPDDATSAFFQDLVDKQLKVNNVTCNVGPIKPQWIENDSGTNVKLSIDEATATAWRGNKITLTIEAAFKPTSDETKSVTVSNVATVSVNGDNKATNDGEPVKVTAPAKPTPEPVKSIYDKSNNKSESLTLQNRTDPFAYTITQKVPENATSVKFSDTVDSCITVTEAELSVDGVTPSKDEKDSGTLVEAELTGDNLKSVLGKTVTLTIKAKLKDNITDDTIKSHDAHKDSTTIPNTATVTVNNEDKTTNTVNVTPPSNTGTTFSLKVTKELSGSGVTSEDKQKKFKIYVYLYDESGKAATGTIGAKKLENGYVVLELKGGDSETITDIPKGYKYKVTESSSSSSGFTVSGEVKDATELTESKQVTIKNTKSSSDSNKGNSKGSTTAKTGDGLLSTMGIIGGIAVIAILVVVLAIVFMRRRN